MKQILIVEDDSFLNKMLGEGDCCLSQRYIPCSCVTACRLKFRLHS